MKTLLSNPFESKLNTWLESLIDRVAMSSVSQEAWAMDALCKLKSKRDSLLTQLGRNPEQAESYHRALHQSARELIEAVWVEDGPTPFAWLNLPLVKLDSYLQGQALDKELPELLRDAFKRVYDEACHPALEAALKELMLWAEGHKQLSGLELKACLKAVVEAANLDSSKQVEELSLPALLKLSEMSTGEDQEQYFETFLVGLESWEEELAQLEAALEPLDEQVLATLESVCQAFEDVSEAIAEEAPWSELEQCLTRLAQSWEQAASHINPAMQMSLATEAEEHFEHLDSLSEVVANFQSGLTGLSGLHQEVSNHVARWSEVEEMLAQTLAGKAGASSLLACVRMSLNSLTTVTSPGDARLSAVTQLYIESLKSLLKIA